MSLLVNTFSAMFILGQFYGFIFQPSYNQNVSTSYLSKHEAEPYTVPIKTFLPSFAILAIDSVGTLTVNRDDLVEWKWQG